MANEIFDVFNNRMREFATHYDLERTFDALTQICDFIKDNTSVSSYTIGSGVATYPSVKLHIVSACYNYVTIQLTDLTADRAISYPYYWKR